MEVPRYMQKGSRGPHLLTLQAFLVGWGLAYDHKLNGLVIDGDFGDKTEEYLKAYQKADSLDQDGKFGPQTRKSFKNIGFDFEAVCPLITGSTTFRISDNNRNQIIYNPAFPSL